MPVLLAVARPPIILIRLIGLANLLMHPRRMRLSGCFELPMLPWHSVLWGNPPRNYGLVWLCMSDLLCLGGLLGASSCPQAIERAWRGDLALWSVLLCADGVCGDDHR